MNELKKHRYPWDLIEKTVSLYLKEDLSYRQLSSKIKDIGVHVSHKTIFEWVSKFKDEVKIKKYKKEMAFSIYGENVTCNGEKMVLYRLLDSKLNVRDIFFNPRKNFKVAKRYFNRVINGKSL